MNARSALPAALLAGLACAACNSESQVVPPLRQLALEIPVLEAFDAAAANPSRVDARQYRVAVEGGKLATHVKRPASANLRPTWVDQRVGGGNTVRGLSVDVAVTHGSGANYSFAGPWGLFYKDTQGRGIQAQINLTSGGQIAWHIGTCPALGGPCGQPSHGDGVLGAYVEGTTRNLSMHWNGGTLFTFALDGAAPVSVDVAPTAPFGSVLPERVYQMGTEIFAASDDKSAALDLSATYDNVKTSTSNQTSTPFSALDDFAQGQVDLSKWDSGELRQEVDGGAQVLSARGNSAQLDTLPGLALQSLAADVTVTASDDASNEAGVMVFPYQTASGQVVAEIAATGAEARFRLVRCGDACTILNEQSLGPIALGSTHTYFIQWDGKHVVYQLDKKAAAVLDPFPLTGASTGASDNPASINLHSLSAQARHNATIGTMTVLVDNLRGGAALTVP
jgi:hypothetical protein